MEFEEFLKIANRLSDIRLGDHRRNGADAVSAGRDDLRGIIQGNAAYGDEGEADQGPDFPKQV